VPIDPTYEFTHAAASLSPLSRENGAFTGPTIFPFRFSVSLLSCCQFVEHRVSQMGNTSGAIPGFWRTQRRLGWPCSVGRDDVHVRHRSLLLSQSSQTANMVGSNLCMLWRPDQRIAYPIVATRRGHGIALHLLGQCERKSVDKGRCQRSCRNLQRLGAIRSGRSGIARVTAHVAHLAAGSPPV
jgi:hypothetical protein